MFHKFKTKRLVISSVISTLEHRDRKDLLGAIKELLTDEVVAGLPPNFQGIDSTQKAEEWLAQMLQTSQLYMLQEHAQDQVIGFLFVFVDDACNAHIGYLLGPQYWGRGLASELIEGLIAEAKNSREWGALIGGVDRSNEASQRLLLKFNFLLQPPEDEGGGVLFYRYQLS